MAEFSRIRIGPQQVKVDRRVGAALRDAIDVGSLVVVGEPGAGKSGSVYDLATRLERDGRDVVVLAADQLAARSLGELRNELGLAHDIVDIFANWPGMQPAFLVIDALDAARSQGATQTLRDLIASVVGTDDHWRVVASIRKFDLRHGNRIRGLFAGAPPTAYRDEEFRDIRHVNIPLLTEEELAQVAAQSATLGNLIAAAGPGLCALLRNPFNLRLCGDLLGSGASAAAIAPARTQLELLDRFWSERVVREDDAGDAREWLLRRAVRAMVEAGELRIARPDLLGDPTAGPALQDLLRGHMLAEWQPSPSDPPERFVLTFAHHILYDYAIARLLLRSMSPGAFAAWLAGDRELALAVRPSLTLHFQHLWSADSARGRFWDLTLAVLGAPDVPEIGKLIGPVTATALATEVADFAPLLAALADAPISRRDAAEGALRHMISALIEATESGQPVAQLDLWSDLAEHLSRSMCLGTADALRVLLNRLCDRPADHTDDHRHRLGLAARRLLAFAWEQPVRHGLLITHAMQAVCRTHASDREASGALPRRVLAPDHLAAHGYEEMPHLAGEVVRLVEVDPALVEEIFRIAFAYQETSSAPTTMGGSQIMPLISNRRQDYDMTLYRLAEAYPTFLVHAPVHATRALIAVLDGYVPRRRAWAPRLRPSQDVTFDFDGREARVRIDGGASWDGSHSRRQEEPVKMADALAAHLGRLADDDAGAEGMRRAVIEVIVERNRHGLVWARLLTAGAAAPATLGREIRWLGWALPILTDPNTAGVAGDYLEAVYPHLGADERERVERAIMSIATDLADEMPSTGERLRDRLLGRLSPDLLVTDDAQCIRTTIAPDEESIGQQAAGRAGWSWGDPERGELGGPAWQNQPPLKSVKEFVEKHRNSTPSIDEIRTVVPDLVRLGAAVTGVAGDDLEAWHRNEAWAYLADACEHAARCDELTCDDDTGAAVRQILLAGADHPDPVFRPEDDEHFDQHPSWGPSARVNAAEGLMRLVGHEVYFASGAFAERQGAGASNDRILTFEEKRRFLAEAGPVLDEIEGFGLPGVVHILIETLQSLVEVDPAAVFRRIGRAIQAGQAQGYQYESLAMDLVVRLVERYLAEYRTLLRADRECQRVLLEILDAFARVGWPAAVRLTYRLEEVFR